MVMTKRPLSLQDLQENATESRDGPLLLNTFLVAMGGLGGARLSCLPAQVTSSAEPNSDDGEVDYGPR